MQSRTGTNCGMYGGPSREHGLSRSVEMLRPSLEPRLSRWARTSSGLDCSDEKNVLYICDTRAISMSSLLPLLLTLLGIPMIVHKGEVWLRIGLLLSTEPRIDGGSTWRLWHELLERVWDLILGVWLELGVLHIYRRLIWLVWAV